MLVEIESYPDSDVDRQVMEDLMLVAVDRRAVPEVVSLILKPKGRLEVTGAAEVASPTGNVRLAGSWPVVRLWELDAEHLLAADNPGLVPWAPLARSDLPPEVLLGRCRDRLARVTERGDRASLEAVTGIMAGLAYSNPRFLDFFGGADIMIESPVLDELRELIRKKLEPEVWAQVRAEHAARLLAEAQATVGVEAILTALEARFGAVPPGCPERLAAVTDLVRLKGLLRLAATCPDADAFLAALPADS